MSTHNSTEIGNIGNSAIKSIFVELVQLDDWLKDPSIEKNEKDYAATLERHWALRETLATTPALSLAELALKAQVLQIEAERDPSFENEGAGSARQLALSLADDVLRLMAQTS